MSDEDPKYSLTIIEKITRPSLLPLNITVKIRCDEKLQPLHRAMVGLCIASEALEDEQKLLEDNGGTRGSVKALKEKLEDLEKNVGEVMAQAKGLGSF